MIPIIVTYNMLVNVWVAETIIGLNCHSISSIMGPEDAYLKLSDLVSRLYYGEINTYWTNKGEWFKL